MKEDFCIECETGSQETELNCIQGIYICPDCLRGIRYFPSLPKGMAV